MLSIIYITRNRCEELTRSIFSCEEHISIKHEYVVIDNGSTDNTHKMMEDLRKKGITVNYYLMDSNYGVSGGRNIGYDKANGDVCYFIDDDAIIIGTGLPLDDAYNTLISHDNVYAMGTDCYDIERKERLIGVVAKRNNPNSFYSLIRNYIGCSHFIRKDKYFAPQTLYPDNLMYGSEELYLGFNVYSQGGEIVLFDSMLVLHMPSKNTRESIETRKRNGHINTFVIKKYYLQSGLAAISTVLFALRIIRFEKYDLENAKKDFKEYYNRFDKKYIHFIEGNTVKRMIKLFGWRSIL